MDALGEIKVDPDVGVPILSKLVTDRDELIRRPAAVALAQYGSQGKAAIPVLVELLRETGTHHSRPRSLNRLLAGMGEEGIGMLADMGEDAKPAVPALLEVWKNESNPARSAAAQALKQIDSEAAEKAGIP